MRDRLGRSEQPSEDQCRASRLSQEDGHTVLHFIRRLTIDGIIEVTVGRTEDTKREFCHRGDFNDNVSTVLLGKRLQAFACIDMRTPFQKRSGCTVYQRSELPFGHPTDHCAAFAIRIERDLKLLRAFALKGFPIHTHLGGRCQKRPFGGITNGFPHASVFAQMGIVASEVDRGKRQQRHSFQCGDRFAAQENVSTRSITFTDDVVALTANVRLANCHFAHS